MKTGYIAASTARTPGAADAEVLCYTIGAVAAVTVLAGIYVVAPAMHFLAPPPASYGVLMAISIYFATRTLLRPQAAMLYAPLFMILAACIVPQSVAVWGGGAPRQYYFWAVGLFFITSALVLRFPWADLLHRGKGSRVPLGLIAFVVVCGAASIQGIRLGSGLSYVARQLYGALLFIIYFCAAFVLPIRRSEILGYLNVLKWFGIGASLYTIIRYAGAVKYGDIGSFKWGLSIYCAMLAVYCMGAAAASKGLMNRAWLGFQALLLIANPIVFQARAATGIAAVASALAFVVLAKSRRIKILLTSGALVIAVAAILMDFIAPIDSLMPHIGNAAHLVPQNILTQRSYVGRVNELLSSLKVARAHPFLGLGLGSSLTFFNTGVGKVASVTPVDQGFAYLISKLGVLGLISFYGLVFCIFRRSGWPARDRLHIAAFVLFFFDVGFMMSHPVMLQFIVSGFAGVVSGLLYRVGVLRPGIGSAAGRSHLARGSHSPPHGLKGVSRGLARRPAHAGEHPW